jgi:hypothetical protein
MLIASHTEGSGTAVTCAGLTLRLFRRAGLWYCSGNCLHCRSVEASDAHLCACDGRRLFEWPDGMWRYGAPPMLTGEHVMGALAGGAE